jgi:hypothetical protein
MDFEEIIFFIMMMIGVILLVGTGVLIILSCVFMVQDKYVGQYGSGTQNAYITAVENGMFRDTLYFRNSMYNVEEEYMHIDNELTEIAKDYTDSNVRYKIYFNRYFFGGDKVYRIEVTNTTDNQR